VDNKLTLKDYFWNMGVRLNIQRDNYKVPPGLYKIGNPGPEDDVIITGNYKLTFDHVRKHLRKNYWLLIINTDGINVWCAAGKGSFGTVELLYALKSNKISDLVSHKRLILPQLSAPGIQGPLLEKLSGFKVIYGPVYAKDLEDFIASKYEKTPSQSQVHFNLIDRLTVLPLESIKPVFSLILMTMLILWIPFLDLSMVGFPMIAVFVGILLIPIILPFRPFQMFYLNGIVITLILSSAYMFITTFTYIYIGMALLSSVWSGYLAYKFTGSTTFTSLSGVKKELKQALPVSITLSFFGITCFLIEIFKAVMT
jgi:hypothetical protein